MKEISPKEALKLSKKGAQFIDLRNNSSREARGWPSRSLFLENGEIDQISKEIPVILICYLGNSSLIKAKELSNKGYKTVFTIKGGFEAWKADDLPIEKVKRFTPIAKKEPKKFNLLKKSKRKTIKSLEDEIATLTKLASLGELSGGIIHEIATPVTIIDSSIASISKSLADGTSPDTFTKKLLRISKAVSNLKNIIKTMKNMSYDLSNDEVENINLEEFLLEIKALAHTRHKVPISLELIGEASFYFNKTKLSQILVNLLNNAADEVSKSSDHWIYLRFNVTNTQLTAEVINSGGKIPSEIQKQMGMVMFTTKEKGKGNGLGLNVVKKYIKEVDGELFINNSYDDTCITIIVPRKVS
jgi:C4-dicarboxylate-specific signal transduction histidine kinase/rhodanese-related sulfurtransferase